MGYSTHCAGSEFIRDIMGRDGVSEDQAVAWLESKTGCMYDPGALYKVYWPGEARASTWCKDTTAKVHIMSDAELGQADREYRKLNSVGPKKPWEPWVYQKFMGKAPGKPLPREPD